MMENPHSSTMDSDAPIPSTRAAQSACVLHCRASSRASRSAAEELCAHALRGQPPDERARRCHGSASLRDAKTRALGLTTAGHQLLEEMAPLLAYDGPQPCAVLAAQPPAGPSACSCRRFLPASCSCLGSTVSSPCIRASISRSRHVDPWPSDHPASADVSIVLTDSVPQGVKAVRLFPRDACSGLRAGALQPP